MGTALWCTLSSIWSQMISTFFFLFSIWQSVDFFFNDVQNMPEATFVTRGNPFCAWLALMPCAILHVTHFVGLQINWFSHLFEIDNIWIVMVLGPCAPSPEIEQHTDGPNHEISFDQSTTAGHCQHHDAFNFKKTVSQLCIRNFKSLGSLHFKWNERNGVGILESPERSVTWQIMLPTPIDINFHSQTSQFDICPNIPLCHCVASTALVGNWRSDA